ncbi:NIPSNAP family protein [Actinomadura montaniterrae]|uniref:NIPSNAP family protein n=1 Tax=Actinomadura montaniterrae TaxID=1803903 RepID=A0A6L3VWV3_9ACTN|nr:NIPSNAP family protein [Actinomadura montaniterrae]KAB2376103.1 NIPSNAP family protein [Actinomadura montaniterrae]
MTAVLTCRIDYTIDPRKAGEFARYAAAWPPIIERCGGRLVGYFLPGDGANNQAMALLDFASLAEYEAFRGRLAADEDAKATKAEADANGCVLVESRTFFRRA